jgi:MtrB/PioB family decaheme-associated outer membrane protein
MLGKVIRSVGTAGICLVPLAAIAQDENPVPLNAPATAGLAGDPARTIVFGNALELGIMGQTATSARFGKYTGTTDSGAYGIGNFQYSGRAATEKDPLNTYVYELSGTNLGLDSRAMGIHVGEQGTWDIRFNYDGIPYNDTDKFFSVYNRDGSFRNGITAGSLVAPAITANTFAGSAGFFRPPGSATTTAYFDSRGETLALTPQSVGTQRDSFSLVGRHELPWSWTFVGALKHEHKEGTKMNSLLVGSNTAIPSSVNLAAGVGAAAGGGTSSLTYFPEYVNYDTERYEATLGYSDPVLQSQFSYVFSKFTNNATTFRAFDPFNLSNSSAANGAAVPTSAMSIYTTPPSNDAHQWKVTTGFNITPTTRIVANAGYTIAYQSSALESMTSGQTGANATAAQLAASNNALNNQITNFSAMNKNFFGNLNFTARPFEKTDFKASYTIDDRSNPDTIRYAPAIQNDSFAATQWIAGQDRAHFTLPYAVRNQTSKAEVGYRLMPETRLSAGWTAKQTDRNFVGSTRTQEDTYYSAINFRPADAMHGMLGYSHSTRHGTSYDPRAAWLALGFTTSFDLAGFVPYNLSNRERDEIRGSLSYDLTNDTILSLNGRYADNNYRALTYGRQHDNVREIGPDLAFSPMENASAHLFYSYEYITYFFKDIAALDGSVPAWNQKTTNYVHTLGAELEWKVLESLTLRGQYLLSYGNTSYAFNENTQVLPVTIANALYQLQDVPSDRSILNSIHLASEYAFTDRISLWTGYALEIFQGSDYLYDQPAVSAAYPNAILPGTGNPSYVVHVIGTSVRIKL